jgi:hypothetical protein
MEKMPAGNEKNRASVRRTSYQVNGSIVLLALWYSYYPSLPQRIAPEPRLHPKILAASTAT